MSGKCLNNVIEQDRQHIKHLIRPMLGFETFYAQYARSVSIPEFQAYHPLWSDKYLIHNVKSSDVSG